MRHKLEELENRIVQSSGLENSEIVLLKSDPKVGHQRLQAMDELEPERRISIGLHRGAQPFADCADERIL